MRPRNASSRLTRPLSLLGHLLPLGYVLLLVVLPLILALRLLWGTAEVTLPQGWFRLDQRPQTAGALRFSLLEASLSTLATVLLGVPLAWSMARYRWPAHRLLRALLTLPFVMPTIVAALGFLALFGPRGPVYQWLGLDLLGQRFGPVAALRSLTGWQSPGPLLALLWAHAWFNLALMVRFVEPTVARLDPALEESVRLLPGGARRCSRFQVLWWPLLWPAVAAAAALTFLFSFTSFALVRWLGGSKLYTLERAMAELGGSAGIEGYGASASEVVLALSTLQLVVMLVSLGLMAHLQQRRRRNLPLVREQATRKPLPRTVREGYPVLSAWARLGFMVAMVVFVVAPLLLVVQGSFKVRGQWSLEPWMTAWTGGSATLGHSLAEPLLRSFTYALMTLLVALPLGALAARTIVAGERSGTRRGELWALTNDMAVMLALALSAVMVGLGMLVGLLRHWPALFELWWLPVVGHLVIAVPFALRVLLPALRSLDPAYDEAARLLGLGPLQRLLRVKFPLLRGPLVVAASMVLAISLGEFGATWMVVTSNDWMTVPVFIDTQLSKPFDPLARPIGHVGATVLMLATLLLFTLVERFRLPGQEGEF